MGRPGDDMNNIKRINGNIGGRKLEYGKIASECAIRLQNSGYLLRAGDRDYIDEVAMMMLSDHAQMNLTEEEMIELVMAVGRASLRHSNEIDLITQSIRYHGYHLRLRKKLFRRTGWYIKGFSEGYRTLVDARAEIDEWGTENAEDFLDTFEAL